MAILANLLKVEKIINYEFRDKGLLKQALCHSSYSNENRKSHIKSNERLEFLGDAVLELVVSEYLFKNYSNMPEGELTKFRASVVCEATLSKRTKELNIGKFIMLGKGEKANGGSSRNSLLADIFESIVGAIYLDSDLETVKKYIITNLKPAIKQLEHKFRIIDYKTYLQEIFQSNSKETVKYRIIDEIGPDHDKQFVAEATHSGNQLGQGIGRTKKEAEQNAALNILNKFNYTKE